MLQTDKFRKELQLQQQRTELALQTLRDAQAKEKADLNAQVGSFSSRNRASTIH